MTSFMMQVKEHRAFTLETMANHSSPTELLQEIRQMVTQLKSYLLQSTELQAMLEPQHQYTPDKMGKIRVDSLAVFMERVLSGCLKVQCMKKPSSHNTWWCKMAANKE